MKLNIAIFLKLFVTAIDKRVKDVIQNNWYYTMEPMINIACDPKVDYSDPAGALAAILQWLFFNISTGIASELHAEDREILQEIITALQKGNLNRNDWNELMYKMQHFGMHAEDTAARCAFYIAFRFCNTMVNILSAHCAVGLEHYIPYAQNNMAEMVEVLEHNANTRSTGFATTTGGIRIALHNFITVNQPAHI